MANDVCDPEGLTRWNLARSKQNSFVGIWRILENQAGVIWAYTIVNCVSSK
jgi:hypothetical protein